MAVGNNESQKEFTRNPVSYGQVTKNLEVLLQDLISAPNEPLPHIAAQHVRGALQFIVDMNGAMDLLETSNKQFQLSGVNATEAGLFVRNGLQYEQVVNNLKGLLENTSDSPNALVPHVTVHHLQGVLQVLSGMSADLDLLERSNKELRHSSSSESEASIITTASSNESFIGRVKKVADVLNIMAKTEMFTIHPEQLKALTDAYILLQGLSKGHMVVYLADPRNLVDPKGFTGMMSALENLLQENAHRDTPHVKLLQNVFNTLVLQLREITGLESSVDELRNMLIEREEELSRVRSELQSTFDNAEKPPRLPALLDPQQPGAENGFWIINRAWHDYAVGSYGIDLATPEGRDRYKNILRSAVAKVAGDCGANTDLRSIATMMVVVEWDSHTRAEEQGDNPIGPVFCSGTLKLLAPGKEAEPVTPVEPPFMIAGQYDKRGLYMINDEWRQWFIATNPAKGDLTKVDNRNALRHALSLSVKRYMQLSDKAPSPIVVIDWDAALNLGTAYFSVPEMAIAE